MSKVKTTKDNIETLKKKAIVIEKLLTLLEKEIKKKNFQVVTISPANGTLTNKIINDYSTNTSKLAGIYKMITELEKNNPEEKVNENDQLFGLTK